MSRPSVSSVSPFFIVRSVPDALTFYCKKLGFEIVYLNNGNDPSFAIVRRDGAMLFLKAVESEPVPNSQQDGSARWDAFFSVPDPDALAAEFSANRVAFSKPLANTKDQLRGFELEDTDGYVLFFGRPC